MWYDTLDKSPIDHLKILIPDHARFCAIDYMYFKLDFSGEIFNGEYFLIVHV